jgi:thiol-disulfide isomerase/thioredoxin
MKRYGALTLIALAFLVTPFLATTFLGGCGRESASSEVSGKPGAPAFSAKTLKGDVFDLAAETGKVVLLDFWATWCPPCRDSIPALERLHEKYGARGLVVLGITNEDPDHVATFVKENKMTYTVAAGPAQDAVLLKYQIEALPTSVVIDKQGRVRSFEAGFTPGAGGTEDKLDALLPKLLAER